MAQNSQGVDLDKAYEASHDKIWQKRWDEAEVARPETGRSVFPESADKDAFSILMPPPNVTGVLHQGHALMLALEDALIRWKRMSGVESLYLPGTDHASIAVNMQVVKHLDAQGINHRDLGREGFIQECWKWVEEYRPRIFNQIKSMGVSCDWSRVKFTMDPELNKGVIHAFVELHKKGLIYRDEQLVNWSPQGQTVLSDLEVIHKDQKGHIWQLKYPVAGEEGRYLIVATTRPETMLGDSAVAVHPEDERYKDLVGKSILLPIVNREIPIVADDYVDPEFGTGAVKITPAHDFNDFEVGNRHDLARINVFTPDAKIIAGLNGKAADWAGLDRFDARKEIVKEFESLGLLEGVEEHNNRIGTSERWGDVVEPYLSHQWFLKMDEMSKRALAYANEGELDFVPEEFRKHFQRWMENTHDWCISRQLWWGQQIPAYHCEKTGETFVGTEAPKDCEKHTWKQDPDVLDTWFSSGLWPLTTLGWPNAEAEDFKRFYPTTVLETGFDIIFFWVARMVMMSSEFTGKPPFEKVYLHPMVRDEHGQKMSKTKGNVIDPLAIVEEFGADTLRLTLNALCVQGRDLKLSDERLSFYRSFINKLWNATRFALMNAGEESVSWQQRPEAKHLHDKWILLKLDNAARDLNKAWSEFRMQEAVDVLYHFVWNDFCDWYLECSKATRVESLPVILHVLGEILKMMHPLCPHATEELWAKMPGVDTSGADKGLLALQAFPQGAGFPQPEILAEFKFFQDVVSAIRNLKAEAKVSPSKPIKAWLFGEAHMTQKVFEANRSIILDLTRCAELNWGRPDEASGPVSRVPVSSVEAGRSVEIIVPVTELKDIAAEKERLQKELAQMEKLLAAQNGKLANENFVKRAPPELVEKEKVKKEEYADKAAKLKSALTDLG